MSQSHDFGIRKTSTLDFVGNPRESGHGIELCVVALLKF